MALKSAPTASHVLGNWPTRAKQLPAPNAGNHPYHRERKPQLHSIAAVATMTGNLRSRS